MASPIGSAPALDRRRLLARLMAQAQQSRPTRGIRSRPALEDLPNAPMPQITVPPAWFNAQVVNLPQPVLPRNIEQGAPLGQGPAPINGAQDGTANRHASWARLWL